MTTTQVVDTDSAREFMREALGSITEEEQNAIAAELQTKHERFCAELAEPGRLTSERLQPLLRSIFSTRRRTRDFLEGPIASELPPAIDGLLHSNAPLDSRFQAFCDGLPDFPETIRHDLASELLHFTFPEDYWLWTRWAWDRNTRTGALSLVTMDYELSGASLGETYLRVGQATAFVRETGRAAGFTTIGGGRFGVDIFLACVYCVYVYTTVRMRMTREFNRVIPQLPELARRFLGVYGASPERSEGMEI
jgi:hypothetical protein